MNARLLSLVLAASLAACSSPPTLPPPADLGPVDAKPSSNGLPDDWHQGVFMEVFVRSYQDSNGDGQGDLRGLIQRLDHLQALGVTGLWLMPVTQSADRDHGYATTDFRAIERDYGSLADFDELLREAHREPALVAYSDNWRQLDALTDAGVITAEDRDALIQAYRALRGWSHARGLQQQPVMAPAGSFATEREQVRRVWARVGLA